MTEEKKSTAKVCNDKAEAEFARFTTALRAKVNTSRMSDQQRRDFENNREVVLDALKDGSLTVDDAGQPSYTPSCTYPNGPIVFRKPTGKTLIAANGLSSETEGIAMSFKMLAQITQQNRADLETLELSDLAVPLAMLAILLG